MTRLITIISQVILITIRFLRRGSTELGMIKLGNDLETDIEMQKSVLTRERVGDSDSDDKITSWKCDKLVEVTRIKYRKKVFSIRIIDVIKV
jgi:hypothetical protein